MRMTGALLLVFAMLLSGCVSNGQPTARNSYQQIDQKTASAMMAGDDSPLIVDVRRIDEYESGHIPGAICIPNESITTEQPEELPNLSQTVLVYCRSGNRSKQAAEKLAAMGYSNIYEFGGINAWTGEVVPGQAVAVTLASNPTTGFRWTAAQDSELFAVRDCYVSRPQSAPVSGSGGWQTFVLTPTQAGTAQVSFTYARPWEDGGAARELSYTFTVSEDFRITFSADGSAADPERGYGAAVKLY